MPTCSALESIKEHALIDFGELGAYPIGVPTRFDFTRTRVNGWERTAISYGMYVVRMSGAEVQVFSDICTHLGCRVTWHPEIQHYVSPCHDGHFDIMAGTSAARRLAPWMSTWLGSKTIGFW